MTEQILSGEEARALVKVVPIEGPWLYEQDGQLFVVRAAPVIPGLSQS